MTALTINSTPSSRVSGNKILHAATRFWFFTTVTGQWIFVLYILGLYGAALMQGDLERWNSVMPHGLIDGDPVGNLMLGVHLLLAAVISFGGPLQLIPQLRNRFPVFHRWNGRIYFVTALVISIAGFYLVWGEGRGVLGHFLNSIAVSLNGMLIIVFACIAVRLAMAGNYRAHQRWALRLFLAVSGVWFFRVGFMLAVLLSGGNIPGSTGNLDGPFDVFLMFAQFMIPLAVLELYFLTIDRAGAVGRISMAALLIVLTLGMAAGIYMATNFMWLPRL